MKFPGKGIKMHHFQVSYWENKMYKREKKYVSFLGNPGCVETHCIVSIINSFNYLLIDIRMFTEDSFWTRMHDIINNNVNYHD